MGLLKLSTKVPYGQFQWGVDCAIHSHHKFAPIELSDRTMIAAVYQVLGSVFELDESRHLWLSIERFFALDDEQFRVGRFIGIVHAQGDGKMEEPNENSWLVHRSLQP